MIASRTIQTRAAWTPVAPATQIKRQHGKGKSPLLVTLHDEQKKLSVFWDEKRDTAAVVNDTCHHRGASISHGIVGQGCVNCLYHNHPTKPKKPQIMVKDDIVWYDDDTFHSTDDDVHASWEFDEGQRSVTYVREFPGCNALYMQENTLDWAHLSHIHAFSFTQGAPEVVIRDDGRAASYIYQTSIPDTVLEVENEFWSSSTCLRFKFGPPDGDRSQWFSLHFAFVPVGKDHCRIIVRVTRCVALWAGVLGDLALILSNELPLIEDRNIVQSIPFDRVWDDDHLCKDDAFLALFRNHMIQHAPEMVAYYAGYRG